MEIELTSEQETHIIPAAIYFLRALTTTLGPEVGLHVWDQINSTIGKDIKGKVFFAMLSGRGEDEIILRGIYPGSKINKVELIRLIRSISGLGLKESKDIGEALQLGQEQRIKCTDFSHRFNELQRLWRLGVDAA